MSLFYFKRHLQYSYLKYNAAKCMLCYVELWAISWWSPTLWEIMTIALEFSRIYNFVHSREPAKYKSKQSKHACRSYSRHHCHSVQSLGRIHDRTWVNTFSSNAFYDRWWVATVLPDTKIIIETFIFSPNNVISYSKTVYLKLYDYH